MRSYVTDEGTAVCEFNLAGFSEDEITIKTDVARHELIITATKDDENNKRSFATNLLLSEYTHPEDISASYDNGVLTISVAPVDKRKEEALVDVPLNRSKKAD
jgi:HSP20 family molecular chaperone IbpA